MGVILPIDGLLRSSCRVLEVGVGVRRPYGYV